MEETTEELVAEYEELLALKAGPKPWKCDMARLFVVDEELVTRLDEDELRMIRTKFLFSLAPEGKQGRNRGEA
tara:strand:- start:1006 stop:1224 length:219 start_codon:yes stop_codon:yes gene_type:complete